MDIIHLQQTLPEVFAGRSSVESEIWHKNVIFRKGETYLIEAASGTGKSSLCNFIYGSRADYQGIITFDEENIKTFSIQQWVDIRKASVSMLFQDLRLFPELTVMDNILLKNNLTGFKKKKEIKDLLEALGIADKIKAKVGKLSFGQQQRVAFLRALCQPCDFFIMDEPVSHLDDVNGEIMGRILMAEAEKQNAGVIITSIGKHIDLSFNNVFKL
jgi:ABC-type antimicrobial peptide transport system, ATPase component